MNHRAYSLLNCKEIVERDDVYVVRGIASTPTPDRVGDIVEPLGAKFALPMPLLWQHDSEKPVGHVTFAEPNKSGIPFEAEIPKVKEAGVLKDRIDEAIQSLRYRLVAAVSIGFKAIEDKVERLKNGGYRFLEWDWMELSLVTIPANAEATISSVKSLCQAQKAASGRAVVSLSPGVPGTTPTRKGHHMTTQEQIAALEAKRAASEAARKELQDNVAKAQRTKNDQERETFDNLTAEIEAVDSELKDLRILAADEAKRAKPVAGKTPEDGKGSRGTSTEVKGSVAYSSANVEKGIPIARAALALLKANGNRHEAAEIIKSSQRWMDQTPYLVDYVKNAIPAGDTTTSGWASQIAYARDMEAEFVELLRPQTILGKLSGVRRVPFNIRYGTQTAGTTGNWVGQGKPIPVSKPTLSSGSLGIAKASVMVAVDEELVRLSNPSAEMLVRDDMIRTLSTFLDVQFVDPNVAASANVSPASITNGVTALTPSGTAAANLRTDLASLLTSLSRNEHDLSEVVWIMTPETALNISLLVTSLGTPIYTDIGVGGGTLLGRPVITSNSANIPGSPASGRMIIAVCAPQILLADDGQVSVDASREASIELLDNPTNASTGATAATSVISMYQTHSIALRCTRFINWGKRYSTCVEYIKEAAYVA